MLHFKSFRLPLVAAITVSFLLISACGGGGSDGSGDSTTPTLPADAIRITMANASAIAADAVSSNDIIGNIANKGSQTETVFGASEVLELIIEKAFNKSHRLSSVANKTETENCDSGSVTINYNETGTSESGTLTFSKCEFSGVVLNGPRQKNSWVVSGIGNAPSA
ncbi:MAG: hypothetical protein GY785_23455 [Gammaproteobacteria bacterium]|nr:hypothetical protein [Gammaproteobacteria bacterium]